MQSKDQQSKEGGIRWRKCIKGWIYGAWAGFILASFQLLDSYGSSFDFGGEFTMYFNPLSYIHSAPAVLLFGFIFWIPTSFVFLGIVCLVEYIRHKRGKIAVPRGTRSIGVAVLREIFKFILFTYIVIIILLAFKTLGHGRYFIFDT